MSARLMHEGDGIAPSLDASNADPSAGTKYDFPRDLVGYGRHPPDAQWPGNAKIAINFVINYEEGAERTVVNGDARSENALWEQASAPPRDGERALNVESDYEYGSRVGIWRLLNLFESYKFPITAYAVGQALEKNPSVAKALVEGGHEVASHAYRWIDYHNMEPAMEKEYILRQLKCIKELTGEYPGGWYYGRLSPRSRALVHEVYKEQGVSLIWEADTYAEDLPFWVDVPAEADDVDPKGMLMLPYTYDNNDMKYATPSGWSCPADFSSHLIDAFDTLYAEGLAGKPKMMAIGLHCRLSGKAARLQAIKRFCEYVASKPASDVWVARRMDVAVHWRKIRPYQKGRR